MSRTRGSMNKVPQAAKENIQAVFIRLGGTAAMAQWARENPTEFYKIYARLLPVEMAGSGSGPVTIQIVKFGDQEVQFPLEHQKAQIIDAEPIKAIPAKCG